MSYLTPKCQNERKWQKCKRCAGQLAILATFHNVRTRRRLAPVSPDDGAPALNVHARPWGPS